MPRAGGQPGVAPGDPHLDLGLADLEPVAALEHRPVDLLSLHLDAVGRAEVDDLEDVGDEQSGVPARDLRVAQLDLAAATAAEVCRARTERDLAAGVGAGHDHGRGDGLAAVGIPLGAPRDGDVGAGAQPALGDGGARVDGAVALGDVRQGEVAQPGRRRRATPRAGSASTRYSASWPTVVVPSTVATRSVSTSPEDRRVNFSFTRQPSSGSGWRG